MAIAFKLFTLLTLLAIFPSIPTSSSHSTSSVASTLRHPPSDSARGSHARLRSHGVFFSVLQEKMKFVERNHASQVQLAAETGNASSSTSSNGNVAADATTRRKNDKFPVLKWLAGLALGATAGALSAFVASNLYRSVRRFAKGREADKPVVFQGKLINAKALEFFKQADAMENLELLGRGGCGEVFKATLGNGITVAIKRVIAAKVDSVLEDSYGLTKNSAQILAELNTLGRVRHLNLVTLLAYIPQPGAHLLVYEYMEHGSLHDVMNKLATKELELPWANRLAIAKNVATGLKYLHLECNPAIIHRDLKPGNILLDKNMMAHIGDFGLAKIIPIEHTHITSNNIAGTLGYIAPEYYQSLKYTAKGDMYAFGVVLIVLVTGKEPIHSFFADVNTSMGKWLANLMASGEESVKEIVDPSLQGHGDEKEISLTLRLANLCLHDDPFERPNADDVLKMLTQITPSQKPSLPSVELLVGVV